jgi:hypothetical protein
MSVLDLHARSRKFNCQLPACFSPRIDALTVGRAFLVIATFCCCSQNLAAQAADPPVADRPNQSWTATTDSKSDNLLPTRLPVRIIESHSQNGERTLDKRSVEIRGTDGHFEPYQDVERETRQVNATTVRTVTRTFSQDVNGKKALVQVTEEEKRILAGDDSNIERVTYNPDVNGKLQAVQRDFVETKKTGKGTEETNRTVMLTNINGGLAPAFKTREVQTTGEHNTAETEKTTWLPDVNGKWQVAEIRHNVATPEANGHTIEETVFRPDAEGKLTQISRVVSHESESTSGEKRSSAEAYSIDVPGTTQDGRLHLVERKSSISRSNSAGEERTEQKVEQINPGDPNAGLRVSVLIDGRMVPGPAGEEANVIIRARDSNGNFGTVSVDMTKSDRAPTIQIEQTPSEQPK